MDLWQSVQTVAGHIQNHLMGRINQNNLNDQPPPYEANLQQR